MSAKDEIEFTAEEQSWNQSNKLETLYKFIDENNLLTELQIFLDEIAEAENAYE